MSYVNGRPPYDTANYGWPIPGGNGLADYITANEALATAIDAQVKTLDNVLTALNATHPAFVASIPTTNLADGQEVYLQTAPMAGVGSVWHLRYRATAPAATRWEFLGGAPIEQTINQGAGGTGYVGPLAAGLNPIPTGPSIVVPRPGDYIVAFGAVVRCESSDTVTIGVDGGGVAADAAPMAEVADNVALDTVSLSVRRNVAAANSTLSLWAETASSDVVVGARFLAVTPIRLG